MSKRILLPVPDRDFDLTEVAVPWKLLTSAGHQVVFATERGGNTPACDPRTRDGVLFGLFGAGREARASYEALTKSDEFNKPISWDAIEPSSFDALLLPGGHAKGMKQYLGSEKLQRAVAEFWSLSRPVAAIC